MILANNLRRYFEISKSHVREREHRIKQLKVKLAAKEAELIDIVDDAVAHRYT